MKNLIAFLFISLISTVMVNGQNAGVSDSLKINIQERIDNQDIVGLVIGLIDGEEVSYYTAGVPSAKANGEINEHTVFEIGSISKTFTGLMLADMATKGKVKLNDPIQQYLPEGIKAPMKNDASIALVHLANYTSGLARLPGNFTPTDMSNPYVDYTKELMYDYLNNSELSRDIGEEYEYSNYATGLLGQILATQNNMSYEDLLISTIAKPLGMKATQVSVNVKEDNQAKGHQGKKEVPYWEFASLEGAGGIRSNASDMMKYLAANMGIEKTKLYPAMQLAYQNSRAEGAKPIVGLGWHTMTLDDQEIVWHNGGTGGFSSFMGWIKGTQKGVVVLCNSTENVDDIGLHALVPTSPLKEVVKTVAVDDAILESYVGKYALAPTFIITVTKEENQLIIQATGQQAIEVYPKSESKFFLKVVEAEIEFYKDADGNVEKLVLFQGGQEMVGWKLK